MAAGKVQPRRKGYQSDVGCTSEAVCRVCYLIVLRTAAEAEELFFIRLFAFNDVTKLS